MLLKCLNKEFKFLKVHVMFPVKNKLFLSSVCLVPAPGRVGVGPFAYSWGLCLLGFQVSCPLTCHQGDCY